MDLEAKLEDEILFSEQDNLFFKYLNKKGIYTIEEYIISDFEKMESDEYRRKVYRAYQGVLKYKYLGEPLVADALLEKKYDSYAMIGKIQEDLMTLGLGNYIFLDDLFGVLLQGNDYVKMIDIVNNLPYKTGHLNIRDFYIEYYHSVLKQETTGKDQKESLETLKKQLVSLVEQQKELDTKISSLEEKINALEGEKNVNGRK